MNRSRPSGRGRSHTRHFCLRCCSALVDEQHEVLPINNLADTSCAGPFSPPPSGRISQQMKFVSGIKRTAAVATGVVALGLGAAVVAPQATAAVVPSAVVPHATCP